MFNQFLICSIFFSNFFELKGDYGLINFYLGAKYFSLIFSWGGGFLINFQNSVFFLNSFLFRGDFFSCGLFFYFLIRGGLSFKLNFH